MSPSVEKNVKAGVISALVIAAIIGVAIAQRDGAEYRAGAAQSQALQLDMCQQRGVKYFNGIGSFPALSDGRNAEAVARERCSRTTSAF